ncbi:MAG TPA: hypothetical protein VFX50_03395, partial [Gemmatimonadales bacterium]|nr:hypothetical protein [Gemmatimonadales bacterium]
VQVRAADTVPIAGPVVLHKLAMATQGPVDTVRTGADGRFAFRVAPDTAAIFLLSSRFAGIEYFSRPLRVQPGLGDSVAVEVHDTSSTAPVTLTGRYLLVSRATQGGRRSVLDLLIVRNPGPLTRAAADSAAPTWTVPLPKDAGDLDAGEGEFSAAAFEQDGDSLRYLAPVLPGERQLVVRYTVPAGGTLEFPTLPVAESLVVMLEEREARVTTDGFARADSTVIDGQTYWRWVGRGDVPAVALGFPGFDTGRDPLPWLVALLGLVLAGGVWLALRRRPGAALVPGAVLVPPRPADDVARLVDAIARLDAEHGGREAELDEPTRARYAAERARLRAELDRALAARGTDR